jgi:hypothetical protein
MNFTYEVSYQPGRREPSGTFISDTCHWYKITVNASCIAIAQRQVESMMGGYNRCLIGPVMQKNG